MEAPRRPVTVAAVVVVAARMAGARDRQVPAGLGAMVVPAVRRDRLEAAGAPPRPQARRAAARAAGMAAIQLRSPASREAAVSSGTLRMARAAAVAAAVQ